MRRVIACSCLSVATAAADPDPVKTDPTEDKPQEITPDELPVLATKPAVPVPVPVPVPVTPSAPRHMTMDELTVPKSFLRFGVNFFGDVSAFATTPDKPHTGFAVGTLALRMTGELGAGFDALGELAFETTDDGPIADIEQLLVRWRRGPGVLQLGRFHTDIGFWNTAYHHGLWLQTPIDRPHIARFEDDGGLLPVHWVGAEYSLAAKVGPGKLVVLAGVGNGRGDIVDAVLVGRDNNEAKAGELKLRFRSASVDVGAGIIYDRIAPAPVAVRPALPDVAIDEIIGSAHVRFRGDGPIAIGEAHVIHHRFGAEKTTTIGAYALLGFNVTSWLTPYVAVDLVDGADADPYFVPDPANPIPLDVIEGLAGLRFETSTWSALKLEVQYESFRSANRDDFAAVVNWSFGL